MLKIYVYILLFLSLYIFYVTNSLLPDPYMDEIFHFPQALNYYNGAFKEWDPKITTPPGLYLVTIGILNPLSKVMDLDFRKISCFRLININFAVGTFLVVYWILQHLHKDISSNRLLLSSFNIATFPVLYFFNFLYYTDCGSTFFVLLMYYWHLKKFYLSASIIGAVSIFFRQTNIVWVFYVAAEETFQTMLQVCTDNLSKKDKIINLASMEDIKKACIPLWKKNWKKLVKKLFLINIGYILVAIGFITFVIINGSIALGDKTAHEVALHIPQLFYFLLFFTCFASPYLISYDKAKKFLACAKQHKMLILEFTVFCVVSLAFFSHVHPYLIADNRHLSFYIWKRILGRNLLSSLSLIPVYIFSSWSIVKGLNHKDVVSKVVIAFCVIVSVVPQKLFEFRYFIIPYMMIRLHLKARYDCQPYLEFLLHFVVNFCVLYLFLFEKFPWEGTERSLKIMW